MRDAGTGIEGNAIASEFGIFTLGSIVHLDLACIMESDDRLSAIDRLSLAKMFSASELGPRFPELRELAKNLLVRYAIQSKISLGEVLRLMCEADSQDFVFLRDAISTSYPNAVFGGLQLSSKEMLTADDKLIISGMQMSNPLWRNRYLELQANRDVKELILSLSVSRDIHQLQERIANEFLMFSWNHCTNGNQSSRLKIFLTMFIPI